MNTNEKQEELVCLDDNQIKNLDKYGFYIKNNAMFFRDEHNEVIQKSNFAITPILRIKKDKTTYGINIMEVVNVHGVKSLIKITVRDMNDEDRLAIILEEAGNYWFDFSKNNLLNLKRYLYDHIIFSEQITNLGWQQDGFWAWANGITLLDKTFIAVDDYGLVKVIKDGVDKWYYIEPFSKVNENSYSLSEQRKFRHEVSNLNFADWCDDYVRVYGRESLINIAALLTSCFGDLISEKIGSFPLIHIAGQPGTGKTEQVKSLLSCFEESPSELNITKITTKIAALKAGLFVNSGILLDEYRNNLDPQWIELMKSTYSRPIIAKRGEENIYELPATSLFFVCGQDIPDTDIALFNRCIIIMTKRPLHSEDEKIRFNDFKKTDKLGKSHFIDEIISHREKIKDEFLFVYEEVLSNIHNTDLSCFLKNGDYKRIMSNYAILLAVYKILWVILGLKISYESMKEIVISCIKTQINMINKFANL